MTIYHKDYADRPFGSVLLFMLIFSAFFCLLLLHFCSSGIIKALQFYPVAILSNDHSLLQYPCVQVVDIEAS